MNPDFIPQAIALLRRAQVHRALALLQRATRDLDKGDTYRQPRAFQSYLESLPAQHQTAFPNWRERLIAGPYHPWEYDEFERAIVEQTQARQITLVYTRETVCICRPPTCLPSPESTNPAADPSAPSRRSRTVSATAGSGPRSARTSSRITRSATATRCATGTVNAAARSTSDAVQLLLF